MNLHRYLSPLWWDSFKEGEKDVFGTTSATTKGEDWYFGTTSEGPTSLHNTTTAHLLYRHGLEKMERQELYSLTRENFFDDLITLLNMINENTTITAGSFKSFGHLKKFVPYQSIFPTKFVRLANLQSAEESSDDDYLKWIISLFQF